MQGPLIYTCRFGFRIAEHDFASRSAQGVSVFAADTARDAYRRP